MSGTKDNVRKAWRIIGSILSILLIVLVYWIVRQLDIDHDFEALGLRIFICLVLAFVLVAMNVVMYLTGHLGKRTSAG